MLPNRLATYALILTGIVGAIAPIAADMDWESTASVIAGMAAIAAAITKFLEGWQRYEERTDLERLAEHEPAAKV